MAEEHEELKDIIRALKELIPQVKDVNGAVVKAQSDNSNLKSSVDKLFEIVVTGNSREALTSQVAGLHRVVADLGSSLNGLRSEFIEDRKRRSDMKTALALAIISPIVSIIIAVITILKH